MSESVDTNKTGVTDHELFDMASRCVGTTQRRLLTIVRIASQEWEDIRSEAVIRVFQQRHHFDPSRGQLINWVFTVASRSVHNSLRKLLPVRGVKAHRWRTNLLLARPIQVRVEQIDRWGEEAVVIEPDILDGLSWPYSELDDFRRTLSAADRDIFDMRVLEGLNFRQIAARKRCTYQWTRIRFNRDIRRLWERYDSGP